MPSLSQLSYEEKVDEILTIVRGLANTAVEHDARIKFIESAVDVNAEDTTGLGGRVRHVESGVEGIKSDVRYLKKDVATLTRIAELQEKRVADHEKSIHALQNDEERRTTYAGDR